MFYLDYIIYSIFIILSWILIYKIINENDEKEGFGMDDNSKMFRPKGSTSSAMAGPFKHRGKAVIAAPPTKPIDVDAEAKKIDIIYVATGLYDFTSIFANIFVKYPNQYINKLLGMSQGPITSIIDKFHAIIEYSKEKSGEYVDMAMDKLKMFKFMNPFSIIDFARFFKIFH
jgi:hypothetical protein